MDKADEAEKLLTPDQYFKYLCMILIYNAYDLVSIYHQNNIENFVRGGLLDELAVSTDSGLTDCYVSSDKRFICNNKEFKLLEGYIPILRIENLNGEIIVEAFNKEKKSTDIMNLCTIKAIENIHGSEFLKMTI